jgi:mono/diheme cytochrome c family protein
MALALIGLAAFFIVTRPGSVDVAQYDGLVGSVESGADVFHAAGCASCHVAPESDIGEAPILAGGQAFASDFGTFYAPNISSDPDAGIGDWTLAEFANAVVKGVSPAGKHYYPAFPYTSYAKMTAQDLVDLRSYIDTLPASDAANQPHDVGFPFSYRRALGGWKFLFGASDWVVADADTDQLKRGRYLVETLGHCGECHTPRNGLGGLRRSEWLAGSVLPGEGKVPGISPNQLDWSAEDIAYYLESGFTPDFDSAGGPMAHVVENMAKLSADDREAIAAYLVNLP